LIIEILVFRKFLTIGTKAFYICLDDFHGAFFIELKNLGQNLTDIKIDDFSKI